MSYTNIIGDRGMVNCFFLPLSFFASLYHCGLGLCRRRRSAARSKEKTQKEASSPCSVRFMLRPLNFRQLTSAKNNIRQEAREEEAVSAFGHGLPSKKMGEWQNLMTRKVWSCNQPLRIDNRFSVGKYVKCLKISVQTYHQPSIL